MSEDKHCRMMPANQPWNKLALPRVMRSEVRIGDLAGHELPIKIPAAKTKAPPTTTWNAACRNGVSI